MEAVSLSKIKDEGREENMKRACLPAIIVIATLLVSVIAHVFATGPTQPPVDTTTLYVGTIAWGPKHADPVKAYDTASCELISNIYDTLVKIGGPVSNSFGTWNISDKWIGIFLWLLSNIEIKKVQEEFWDDTPPLNVSNPDGEKLFKMPIEPGKYYKIEWYPWLDSNKNGKLDKGDKLILRYFKNSEELRYARMYHVASIDPQRGKLLLNHTEFILKILGKQVPIKFFDFLGDIIDRLNATDVEYTFKRALVQDLYGSPTSYFYKMWFEVEGSDFWVTGDSEDAYILSELINGAIEVTEEYEAIMYIGTDFPVNASYKY